MSGADEHAYFLAIEEAFIRLRGAPLLLSPADWQVASEWYGAGIPLDLVLGTLEEIFARRSEREEKGSVQTLRYCRRAVEQAWKERRELIATGSRNEPRELDHGEILAALVAALPASMPGRAELAAKLSALEGDSRSLESQLSRLDGEMLAAAEAALDPQASAALDRAVDEAIAGLASRLEPEELADSRERLRRQILRRRASLPVLSLFAAPPRQG